MNGKSKCKILKDIRRQIARDNDIEYVTSECKYQGECSGTCPKCEAEVRYLEEELRKRQRAGKAVAVAGIAVTLAISSTGCVGLGVHTTPGEIPMPQATTEETGSQSSFAGMVVLPRETDPTEEELTGVPADTAPPTEEELMGDTTLPTVEVMGEVAEPME